MKARVVILMFIAVLVVAGVWAYTEVDRSAKRVAEDSAQRALLTETVRLLETHYATHKSYPQSLTELQFMNWPDGSSPRTLRTFQYESRGTSYFLTCTSVWTGEAISVKR